MWRDTILVSILVCEKCWVEVMVTGLLLTSTGQSKLNNDPLSFVLKNGACASPKTIFCMDDEVL